MNVFISQESPQPWFAADTPLYQHHCRFALPSYQDKLFSEYNINLPGSMQKAVPKRRAEFLAGRYCSQQALAAAGHPAQVVGIGEKRNPLWPTGILGAISHAQQYAVALVAPKQAGLQGIGIDIEKRVAKEQAQSLQTQIMSAAEIALVQQLAATTPLSPALLFTLVFSAKESFFKAAFPTVQAYFGFEAVALQGIELEQSRLAFRVSQSPHPQFPEGMPFYASYIQLPDNMIASFVCL